MRPAAVGSRLGWSRGEAALEGRSGVHPVRLLGLGLLLLILPPSLAPSPIGAQTPAPEETPPPSPAPIPSPEQPTPEQATPEQPTPEQPTPEQPTPDPEPPTPDPEPPPPPPIDPTLVAAIEVRAPELEPWRIAPGPGPAAELAPPAIELTIPAGVRGVLKLTTAEGRAEEHPLPDPIPEPWRIAGGLLPATGWELPAVGLPLRWELLDPGGAPLRRGEVRVRLVTAEETLSRLEAEAERLSNAGDAVAWGAALEELAHLALRLGVPERADAAIVSLRSLAPMLAALDPAAARRSSVARVLLSARIQRTYVDADPVHARASLERVERLASGPSIEPAARARCNVLLAESAFDRLDRTPDGAERRRLLDRARALARSLRDARPTPALALEGELLWARVALSRGWRTESEETLGAISSLDPRVVARAAALGAQVATLAEDEARRVAELERAITAIEALRRHAGSLAIDAGLVHQLGAPYRQRIETAARRGDAAEAWATIEAMRPREPGRAPVGAGALDALRAEWPEGLTLLACIDLDTSLVTVRAGRQAVAVARTETESGATRARVRALLRARGSDSEAAGWLAERLIAPHRDALQEEVVLAPFGVLRSIPFDLLSSGRAPLGSLRTWSVADAAGVAARSRGWVSVGPVASFVDPDTDHDGDGAVDRPRLPSTVGEAAAWEDVPGGFIRARGARAEEARLRVEAPWLRLLHLGCHGEFSRHRPLGSRLLLAAGSGADGRLTAAELARLDLSRCALVSLSGCETGLTRAEGGDDLAGFPRAVLQAGASAFLGSLWPVEDSSAGAFFREFHRVLRREGDPRLALQEARASARRDPERRLPRHWAGWVLLEATPVPARPQD